MISRRTVLGAGLAGIPAGVGAGLGVRWWMNADATIRILGQDESMIALLDTGNERVLFLLGEPDTSVLNNLPQLLSFGRRRVDMIVASHRWLTTDGLRTHLELHKIATLSLQSSASAPPIRGNVFPVVTVQRLRLGDDSDLQIVVSDGGDSDPDELGTDPNVTVEIICNNTRLVLANRAQAVAGIDTGPHLLAVPGDIEAETVEHHQPEIFVGTALHPGTDVSELQVFHNDPVSFTMLDGSVRIRGDQFLS